MSAGGSGAYPGEPPVIVHKDLALLAPGMHRAVSLLLEDCAHAGIEAAIAETVRDQATQAIYYARGRTQIPPRAPVTWVRDARYGWHLYGLAVDLVHATEGWNVPPSWYASVAALAESRGLLKWGGRWRDPKKDLPHFQWARCKASPSDEARRLLAAGGVSAVWRAVGAL